MENKISVKTDADFEILKVFSDIGQVKPIPIKLVFEYPDMDCIIHTLEGEHHVPAGSVIMTGLEGERYAMSKESFLSKYTDIVFIDSLNQKGIATKKVNQDMAYDFLHPNVLFTAQMWNGLFDSTEGDYLLRYGENDFGIIKPHLFARLYTITKHATNELDKYIQFLSTKSSCNTGSMLFDLGDYYYGLDCYLTAINFYKKIVEMQYVDSDFASVMLGICYMNIDDEQNAIFYYELALSLNQSLGDDKLLYDLGLAYSYSKNYEKAIDLLQKSFEFNSLNALPLYCLSTIYNSTKNYIMAKEVILKAIEINDSNGEYYYVLGQIYSALYTYPEAINAYKKTIELLPEHSNAMCNLSDAYNHLHNYESAIFYAKKSLELNSNDYYSYANLGESYEKLGQIALGIDSYSSALKINPEFEGAKSGLARLLGPNSPNE